MSRNMSEQDYVARAERRHHDAMVMMSSANKKLERAMVMFEDAEKTFNKAERTYHEASQLVERVSISIRWRHVAVISLVLNFYLLLT